MKAFFCSIVVIFLLCAGSVAWLEYTFESPGPLPAPATVVVPPNTHFTAIATLLAGQHVISNPLLFEIYAFEKGQSSRFKAGEYEFPAHIAYAQVAEMMASGKTVVHRLIVPEGLMTSEILELINHAPGLEGEITLDIHEGDLLPETSNYSRGDKRNDMLTRMHRAMVRTLDDAWAARAPGLPLANEKQLLTLASIVEKETGVGTERAHVAGIYINRLRKGMLLQADPTTAYAITAGKYKLPRPLTLKDLEFDSPYNTYRYTGLPPGPIANPGKASLMATARPQVTDDLYFVATGNGGHYFARTVEEHIANVKKYRATEAARAAKSKN